MKSEVWEIASQKLELDIQEYQLNMVDLWEHVTLPMTPSKYF